MGSGGEFDCGWVWLCIERVFDGVWWGEWVGDDGDDGDDGLMGFVCEMNWVGVERVRVQREALTVSSE